MHSPKGDPIFRYHLDSDACGPEMILTELFKQPIVLLEVSGGSCASSAALLCVLLCIKAASHAAPRAKAAVGFFFFFSSILHFCVKIAPASIYYSCFPLR